MAKSFNAKTQATSSGVVSAHSAKKTHTQTNNGRGGSAITAKQVGARGAGKITKSN